MATYLLLLLPFLFSMQPSTSQFDDNTCGFGSPVIRFPFGLNHATNAYPGFTLKCNHLSQTVLTLPHAGDFLVDDIDYEAQAIYIRDSKNCLPRRFLNGFNLAGSPYIPESNRTYSFLDCPTNFSSNTSWLRIVRCLSDENHTTVAIPTSRFSAFAQDVSSCTHEGVLDSVVVPVPWASWSDEDTRLVWDVPDCKSCETRGGTCGFKGGGGNSGLEVGCSNLPHSGLPRSAQYGIILGAGVPGSVCIIGVACFLSGKLHAYSRRRRQPDVDFSTSTAPQPSVIVSGLDGPTIESYPKTLLGESKRLPKPGDTTCPICLCEYQPKETLRTIPECNHFFHAVCIDEWLKMNATCPLCRNSPEASSRSTPPSSLSLSSTLSPSSSSTSGR